MAESRRFISSLSLRIVIFSSTFNLDYIALTTGLFKQAKGAFWLPMGISIIISLAVGYVLTIFATSFKGGDLVTWLESALGKWVGAAASVAIMIGLFFIAADSLSNMVRLTQITLLRETPTESLFLITLFVCMIIARQRFPAMIRFSILVTLLTVPLILITGALLFIGGDIRNFMPLAYPGMSQSLKGILYALPQSRGPIIMLFLVPYLLNPETLKKDTLAGVLWSMLGITFMLAATVAVLGTASTWILNPTLIAYQIVHFTPTGIERLDFVFLITAIMIGAVLVVRALFLSSFLASRILGLRDHRFFVLASAPIIYGLAILPSNAKSNLSFYLVSSSIFWLVGIVLPIMALCVGLLKRKVHNASTTT